MTVPLLDLKPQLEDLGPQIKEAVCSVIDSTRYVMGPNVAELEMRIAETLGVEHAVGVSSGSDALLVSLMAVDVGPGDLVVTTPYTFFATAGAIARLGANPAFVDIDPETYNINPHALRQWIRENPQRIPQVKALLPVHLFGQCAEMGPILEIAREFDIPVIEDAAQAIGAKYPSRAGFRNAGSMGTLGCLSFFPSKNLGALGDGGMILTDDRHLAGELGRLRNHGAEPKYYHAVVGGNFRLDALQAAVLLVKLPHLHRWNDCRRQNAAYYDKRLDSAIVRRPAAAFAGDCHAYNQYVVSVSERRDDLRRFLLDHHVHSEVYYPLPLHLQACFRDLGYRQGDLPCSEYAAAHSLALPIYPGITRDMQDYVIETIGAFYE